MGVPTARSPLDSLLDLPFTIATRTVDLLGMVSEYTIRRVVGTVEGVEAGAERVDHLVDDVGEPRR